MLMSPEFTERIRHVAASETGEMDLTDLREKVAGLVKSCVAEALQGGEIAEQVRVVVQQVVSRQEVTSTRMLRLKDLKTASDPGQVQEAEALAEASGPPQPHEILQDLVESDGFKIALDDRFRTMLEYLKSDVIPRQVKKILEDRGG
jgi:hypothetical protein